MVRLGPVLWDCYLRGVCGRQQLEGFFRLPKSICVDCISSLISKAAGSIELLSLCPAGSSSPLQQPAAAHEGYLHVTHALPPQPE